MKLNRKVWNNDFPQIKKAKLLGTTYDYGCVNGRGHFTSFKVSPGIELIFVDFDTSDSISYTDSAVCPDFLQLTYCRRGCCEYELPGGFIKTTSEGEVSILNNDNIPLWARFPLSVYQSANIQIDQKVVECGEDSLFKIFSLDTKKIRHQLNLTRSWYTRMTGGKIRQAFLSLFDAFEHGEPDYFRIKIIEILYLVSKITEEPLILHDSKPGTTDIINYIRSDMLDSLNSQLPISRIVKKYDISQGTFNHLFKEIYEDTPYLYLKKYKMKIAAYRLYAEDTSVTDIAADLGYDNPSKFSSAFKSVYNISPREYRRSNI